MAKTSGPTIHSLEDLTRIVAPESRPLCLFSGGLDGAYVLHYLSGLGCDEVTALTVDLGGDVDREAVENICRRLGARSVVVDRRREFAEDFVIPSIAAQSTYLGGHPICASLSRPLMARAACAAAAELGCDLIIHTSDQSQNSLRRFNGALMSLACKGHFGSPFESSSMTRAEKREALYAAGVHTFQDRVYSNDSNFWGREFEYGELDDPENVSVPEFLYRWTKSPPDLPESSLSLTFRGGVPVALDDAEVEFVDLVDRLNARVGAYGLGRYIGLEEIQDGTKVQEVREMPAAYVLLDAYRRLESGCLGAESIREKMHVEQVWVREAVEGRWYDPLRNAADAFISSMARHVTGRVSYRLGPNKLELSSLQAERPLYIRDRGHAGEEHAVNG